MGYFEVRFLYIIVKFENFTRKPIFQCEVQITVCKISLCKSGQLILVPSWAVLFCHIFLIMRHLKHFTDHSEIIFAAIECNNFVSKHMFLAIYFPRLKNWLMEELCEVCSNRHGNLFLQILYLLTKVNWFTVTL